MEKLKAIVDEAMAELTNTLSADQSEEVKKVIHTAVIRGVLEGQHRAVDACKNYGGAGQNVTDEIASAIRQKNDLLITNLSSLR